MSMKWRHNNKTMAFLRVTNALVLLQLLLVCSSIAVYGDEVDVPEDYPPPPVKPPYPPVKPPTKPPVKPPVTPPTPPPVKPPIYPPPRKMVAVQGVVYCKSCKYRGIDTVMGAAPLAGAVVKLQCKDKKFDLVEQAETDKNGYFFFAPPTLTTAAHQSCRVFLVSSPLSKCSVPTNLGGGVSGAVLIPASEPPIKNPKTKQAFVLFNVGPFAFEPKKEKCYY